MVMNTKLDWRINTPDINWAIRFMHRCTGYWHLVLLLVILAFVLESLIFLALIFLALIILDFLEKMSKWWLDRFLEDIEKISSKEENGKYKRLGFY